MKRTLIISIILFLIAFLCYFNSLSNGFIDVDDMDAIVNNPIISNLTPKGVMYLLIPHNPSGNGYYPINHLFNMAAYAISGEFNPFYFRLMSVLAHCFVVIACFFTVSLLCKSKVIGFWTALIFAIHPSHTEAVNWISSNCHMFTAFFGFLSIFFYILKIQKENKKTFYYLLSLFMFVLANMSKSSIILLPFLLFLYEYWIAGKRSMNLKHMSIDNPAYSISLFVLTSLIFVVIRGFLFYELGSYVLISNVFGKSVIFKLPALFLKYLGNAFMPFSKDLDGVTYLPHSFNSFYFAMLALSAILLSFVCYLLIKNQKLVILGIISFIILLLPGIIMINTPTPFSMRMLYFPSFGIYLGFCLLIEMFIKKISSKIHVIKYIIILLCFFILADMFNMTVERNKKWRSSKSIWSNLLFDSPSSHVLGAFRLSKLEKDPEKRIEALEGILSASDTLAYGYPHFTGRIKIICYSSLAEAYIQQNKEEEKIREIFHDWHRWSPRNAYPLWALGKYYEEKGWLKKAQSEYEKAVKVYSKSFEFWNSLARIYEKQNLMEEADKIYTEISKRWPDKQINFHGNAATTQK